MSLTSCLSEVNLPLDSAVEIAKELRVSVVLICELTGKSTLDGSQFEDLRPAIFRITRLTSVMQRHLTRRMRPWIMPRVVT